MPYTISATYRDKPDKVLGYSESLTEARAKAIKLWAGDIWHVHITHKGMYSGQLYYYNGWKWNTGKAIRPLNKNGTLRK